MTSRNLLSAILIGILILNATSLSAQYVENLDLSNNEDIYNLDFKRDAILLGGGLFTSILGTTLLGQQDPPTLAELNALDPNDVWSFDRTATDNNSKTANTISDIVLYSTFALPTSLFLVKNARGEELQILTMFAEMALINTGITNIVKVSTSRLRPNTYNPLVSQEIKLRATSNRSFFSGHTSNAASFSFFTASVLNDLYPNWKAGKYITWGAAITIPAVVAYTRVGAGKHFPSDVIAGYLFGAAVGVIIPKLHKSKGVDLQVGLGSIYLQKTL